MTYVISGLLILFGVAIGYGYGVGFLCSVESVWKDCDTVDNLRAKIVKLKNDLRLSEGLVAGKQARIEELENTITEHIL